MQYTIHTYTKGRKIKGRDHDQGHKVLSLSLSVCVDHRSTVCIYQWTDPLLVVLYILILKGGWLTVTFPFFPTHCFTHRRVGEPSPDIVIFRGPEKEKEKEKNMDGIM